MGAHLIAGEFQSDKYQTTPRGKVPLSCKDPTAQDLLWEYAQRRRVIDAEFSDDLEQALIGAGYKPPVVCPKCGKELRTVAGYYNHWAQLHWAPAGKRPEPLSSRPAPQTGDAP